jgi:hypothetical protein
LFEVGQHFVHPRRFEFSFQIIGHIRIEFSAFHDRLLLIAVFRPRIGLFARGRDLDLLAQEFARLEQARFDRFGREAQNLGYLAARVLIHVLQTQDDAKRFGQPDQRRFQTHERSLAFGSPGKGDYLDSARRFGRQIARGRPQSLLAPHRVQDVVARDRMEPVGQVARFAHVRNRAIREHQYVVQLILRLFLVTQHAVGH